jgi:hypothetical protein
VTENVQATRDIDCACLGRDVADGVSAAASSTYTEWIHGSELPNATTTEGQFVGESTGSYDGTWYIDVRHQDLSYHPAYITGGSFQLNTFVNGWPSAINGSFTPWGGTVSQLSGFSGCTNQRYAVHGALGGVGIGSGRGTGSFSATLTHYRANFWLVGCVVYAASVSGTVSLTY